MRLLTRQGCPQGPPSFTAGEAAGLFHLWQLESFGSVGMELKTLASRPGSLLQRGSKLGMPLNSRRNSNWSVTLVIWVVVVLLVVSDVMVWAVSRTPGSKSPLLSSVCRKKMQLITMPLRKPMGKCGRRRLHSSAVHSKAKTWFPYSNHFIKKTIPWQQAS